MAIAVGAMGSLGFAVTSPILPDLADSFEVSRGSIGLVQSAVSIPGVLLSALIGYLADRVGRRRVVLIALLIFSVFGVAGFFARSFWVLVALRFCQGVGTSGILGVGIVLIGDAFEGQARTRAMGINITGITLISMSGPIASGLLATGGTFRPFLIFVVGFPLTAWASRMPADRPAEAVAPPTEHMAAAVREMRDRGTLRDYVGLLIASLAAVFILHGLGLTVSPLFLEEEFGVPVAARGFIVAAFQAGTILVAIRIGTLLTRIGARRSLTSAFWLMALGTSLAGVAPQAWVVGAGLAIAGFGFGFFIPQVQSYSASAGGDRYRGVTVLMWVTIVRTAQALGPPTGSQLADRIGTRVVFLAAAAGMALIATTWQPARRVVSAREAG